MHKQTKASKSKHDHLELLSNLNSSWPAAKSSANPPGTLPRPIPNPPKTHLKPSQERPKSAQERPEAPTSVQERAKSGQQASQGRPKSAQERLSAARILSKTSLNGAPIAVKTNFYVFLSLALFNSNSLSVLFAIFRISFMSPTLNFIGFLHRRLEF